MTALILASSTSFAAWSGVDEVVLEKTAHAAGRESWGPLIEIEEGDLGLFVFMLAGLVGGFFLGYYYHQLFQGTGRRRQENEQRS